MNSNEEWLLTNKEEALEPNLPICDPHHHLWDFNKTYIEETYLLTDILKDTESGHNIVSTVFIECGAMYSPAHSIEEQVINETEFVNGIAAMSNSGLYGKTKIAEGIVGSAPLLFGDKVANILDKHISVAPKRFKGIRSQAAMHPDGTIPSTRARPIEGVYINDMFHQGFAHLEPRNLSFEAWCYHPQLPQLIQLARKFPNTSIILNHFGGPLGIGSFSDKEKETYSFDFPMIIQNIKLDDISEAIVVEELSRGPKKFMGICKLNKDDIGIRIDIMYTKPEEYPFAVLYFTGSKEFNVKMRADLLERGMTLNEHALKNTDTKKPVDHKFVSEEDIFSYLGMEYVHPCDR